MIKNKWLVVVIFSLSLGVAQADKISPLAKLYKHLEKDNPELV